MQATNNSPTTDPAFETTYPVMIRNDKHSIAETTLLFTRIKKGLMRGPFLFFGNYAKRSYQLTCYFTLCFSSPLA